MIIENKSIEYQLNRDNTTTHSEYQISYEIVKAKMHCYSIKLRAIQTQRDLENESQKEIMYSLRIVLRYIEITYGSGIINSYRKNELTSDYQLIEHMLNIIYSGRVKPEAHFLRRIYAVSRHGELKNNRRVFIDNGGHAKYLSILLSEIEPVERRLQASEDVTEITCLKELRNALREKYVKVIQSFNELADPENPYHGIPADITKFYFFQGKACTYQFVVNDREFQLVRHNNEKLIPDLFDVNNVMSSALSDYDGSIESYEKLNTLLSTLYGKLVSPVTIAIRENIQIFPDGLIVFLPFEMLLNEDGKYLIKRHSISYGHDHISDRIIPLPATFQSRKEKFINPAYQLPGTEDEWSGTSFRETPAILHIAAHQIMQKEEPVILLSEKDSIFRTDFYKEEMPRSLLLSTCAGLEGLIVSGEGTKSFGMRAYETGVENIISGLWSIDDYSSGRLIRNYMNRLLNGEDSDKSLRVSKIEFLEKSDRFHQHPIYWAAFIHYGNKIKIIRPLNDILVIFLFLIPLLFSKTKIKISWWK
ncbi:MAG: CHAT domain-containing protein [Cyclobacteriaceae bacterium]